MRIVRPYGESIAPGAGNDRLLRLKKQLRDDLGDPPERAIPVFATSHDELVIAQWISTIDKIATKPKGQHKPTPAQRDLRGRLGAAAWQLLVEKKLLPALADDAHGYFEKLWWFKIHPYPQGEAKPRYQNGHETPNPRGRWYRRFAGDVEPEAIDAAAVARRIHEHLHEREYRHGTEQKHEKGRIERRADSIAENTASLAQVTKQRPAAWTAEEIQRYADQAGDVAAAIKQAAEAREADGRRAGADVAAAVLFPAFGKLFSGKRIDEALAEAPRLASLHLAIRDFYRQRLKRHKKKRVSIILPPTMHDLQSMLGHTAANRELSALVRLGKVIHYEAALRAESAAGHGDAPAHVLDDWPADVTESYYWSSAGQAEIKRNEAFVRIWRHSLALAAQTLRDWGSPDGSYHTDILSADGIRDLPDQLKLDHHAGKLAVLLGNRAELFLDRRDEAFQRDTLKLALQGLTQLRHNSFHFNGLGGFASALKMTATHPQTAQRKVTVDLHFARALRDLWKADRMGQSERLIDTLEAAHLQHFFDGPTNQRLIAIVAEAKQAVTAHDLPLPRFRRLLDRAANIRSKYDIRRRIPPGADTRNRIGINLRLPKPANRQQIKDSPAVHAQYVALKLLYENPFRQWVTDLDTTAAKEMIRHAVARAEAAAKDLHDQKDAERREVITSKAKDLAGLAESSSDQEAEGEKLRDFCFRLSRETATEMRVQRHYESDADGAREQAAYIEELLIDVLAQAFDGFIEEQGFGFLLQLRANTERPEQPQCELQPPKLQRDEALAPRGWQLLLYFLLHLIPVDDVGRLLHQIRKWDIVAGKPDGTRSAGDADVDRVVRTLTLYLDMHDAKFTGHQALGAIGPLHELYASKKKFESFFVQKSLDKSEPIPRRGLREILRFGHLPPLRAVFAAHQVEDQTVQKVEAAEKDGTLAEAQRERERLHKLWVDQRQKLDSKDLRGYVDALAEVTRHRHAAAHVRLVNHVELHRLMLAVLGRLLDFAGLFERDLYFAMLALIYRQGESAQSAFKSGGRGFVRKGQIIEARRSLKDGSAIEPELERLFGPPSGEAVAVRNNFSHFNMLNPARSCGPMIDLTAQVNAARRLMGYDRKLKNAVTQSVIELVEREGLHLSWQVEVWNGEHVLVNARVRGKQAPHLRNLGLFETGQREREKPACHLTESLPGRHLVEMVATLFAGTTEGAPRDVTSLPLQKIDWQRSAGSMSKGARGGSHPQRPAKQRGKRAPAETTP